MAQVPQQEASAGPGITEAFVADRQMFWSRFTNFTMGAVIVVVVILLAMWMFLA